MNRHNVPNIVLVLYLYIHIHYDGKRQVEARANYGGLGSTLTSKEDIDIRLPLRQVKYEPTEADKTLDDGNVKPRNFLIKRRESKKLTPKELKSIRKSKKRKKMKKHRKKNKKVADVRTFMKDFQNQTSHKCHNKVKPFGIVVEIKVNE